MFYCLILSLVFGCVSSAVIPKSPNTSGAKRLIIPNLGTLDGKTSKTFFTERVVDQYLGINYAKAPSGEFRFQPPQKFPAWEGVYLADRMRQRCPQMDMDYYPNLNASEIDQKEDLEDCLVVNVFTPQATTTQLNLLPVMFYVHGGSFYAGSAYDFLPDFLLEKDIVLVVVQYRLGPLGFLSLQTDSIPGNAGMLDIIMALEWVQDNIIYFRGDASKVTIVGQSAGGAAVSSLLVSPLTRDKGLFSQVIVQSGSVVSPWAVSKDPVPSTKRVAHLAQCNSQDDQEIADCLRKVPLDALITAHMAFLQEATSAETLESCNLVIQKAGGARKFLDKDPKSQLISGDFLKVPIMGGSTRDEGTAFAAGAYEKGLKAGPDYFKRNIVKDLFDYFGEAEKANYDLDFYSNEYFSTVNNAQEAAPSLIDLSGAILIKAPSNEIVRQMATYKDAYLYSFDFLGNVSKLRASEPNWDPVAYYPIGVTHSDELGYLFPSASHEYSKRELEMVQIMVDLWTNFVINGSPASQTSKVPNWPKMSNAFGPYLQIDTKPAVKDNIYQEYRINQLTGYKVNSSHRMAASSIAIITIIATMMLR